MFTKKSIPKVMKFLIKSYAIPYAKMHSHVVAGAEFRLLHSNEHDDKQLFISIFSMSEKSEALKSTF